MTTQVVYIPSGSTNVTIDVSLIQNASGSAGNPITGLAYNTGSLTCYYDAGVGASTAITLVTQTATGAWSSGGFVAKDGTNMPGNYRFDLPNSLIPASGELNVVFNGASNLATHTVKIIPTQQMFLGQFVESYAPTTVVPNASQALQMALAMLTSFNWVGATLTVTKRNNSTTAMVCTGNSVSNPTALTQTT